MAARGSPMGILMIAAGVVFLNLAYTGKGKDVWAALMGSSPTSATTGTEPGVSGNSSGAGLTQPNTVWANGKVFTIAAGDPCPAGYHKATSPDATMCYAVGDATIAHWGSTGPCHDWVSATDESGAVVCITPPPAATASQPATSPPIGPTTSAGQATISGGLQPRYVSAIYPPSPGWHVV